MSTADNLIPSFSSELVEGLPTYYKALALHLAGTGRLVIEGSSSGSPDAKKI